MQAFWQARRVAVSAYPPAATYYLHGNSYLAVYISGLIVGNSKFVHKRSTRNFFDGITWLAQLSMFLTLGLLVNPSDLKTVLVPGLIVSFLMIFIARPLSVFISLAPFKQYAFKDRLFVSWVGLRGTVPIIFAITCRAAGVEHSDLMFNIVFLCTLVSLVVQGTTLPLMARWLGVSEEPKAPSRTATSDFDIDFPEEIKSASAEIEITEPMLEQGDKLMDLQLPSNTLVIMVKRGDNYFVPTGKTSLHLSDRLLVLSDDETALDKTLRNLGVTSEESHTPKKRRWYDIFFDVNDWN